MLIFFDGELFLFLLDSFSNDFIENFKMGFVGEEFWYFVGVWNFGRFLVKVLSGVMVYCDKLYDCVFLIFKELLMFFLKLIFILFLFSLELWYFKYGDKMFSFDDFIFCNFLDLIGVDVYGVYFFLIDVKLLGWL